MSFMIEKRNFDLRNTLQQPATFAQWYIIESVSCACALADVVLVFLNHDMQYNGL